MLVNFLFCRSQFSHTVTIGKEKESVKDNGNDDFKPVRLEDLFKNIKQNGLLLIHGGKMVFLEILKYLKYRVQNIAEILKCFKLKRKVN